MRDALASSGLPSSRLEIEVTEGVVLPNTPEELRRLTALAALGVGIAMDDFGTGYSSLSCLNSLPLSKIKIDQSFVRGPQTARSRALVKSIVALGRTLQMTTVAEGVETEAQIDELARHGCDVVQGYLIGRPMPPDAVRPFITAREAAGERDAEA